MKRPFLTASLLAAFVVLLAAAAQTDTQFLENEVSKLSQQVADLALRVARLEHAAGGSGSVAAAGPNGSAGPGPVRSMRVDGIHPAQQSSDNSQEIAQLQSQIASLKQTLEQQRQQMSSVDGTAIQSQMHGEDVESNRGNVDRQIDSQRTTVEQYATQLGIKQQKLERLQQAQNQPRQIINGSEGDMIITLQTKFDMTRSLDNISVGEQVSWTGQRIASDAHSETWVIETIAAVE